MIPPDMSGLEVVMLTARPEENLLHASGEGFGPGYDLPKPAEKSIGDIVLSFGLKDKATKEDGNLYYRILEVVVEEVTAVREVGDGHVRTKTYDSKQVAVYHINDKGIIVFSMLDDCLAITSETPMVRDRLYSELQKLNLDNIENLGVREKLETFYSRVQRLRMDNVIPMPGLRLEEDVIHNHMPRWRDLLERTTDYLQDKLFMLYIRQKKIDLTSADTNMDEVHDGFYNALGVLPYRADVQVKGKIARVLMDRLPLNAMVYDNDTGYPVGFNESLYKRHMLEEVKQELLHPKCQEALRR